MDNPKIWEIWYAEFKYEEDNRSKDRPVLIVEVDGMYYVSAMITSHEQRDVFGEVDISYWKSAGLDHPSTVRTTRILELPLSAFRRKIGDLKPVDIMNIRKSLY